MSICKLYTYKVICTVCIYKNVTCGKATNISSVYVSASIKV